MDLHEVAKSARGIGAWWTRYGFFAWTVAVVATATLGYIGFSSHPLIEDREAWDRIYMTLQLFVLDAGTVPPPVPWQLEIARILAPALAALGLVGAFALFVRALTQQDWRLRWLDSHTVVCGLGERGSALTRALRPTGSSEEEIVVVETGANPEDIQDCRDLGALIITGDATDPGVLKQTNLGRARRMVVLAGEDGTNAEIAATALEMLGDRAEPPLEIYVQITDPEFRTLVETRVASTDWERSYGDKARLRVVNVFERLADRMLDWPAHAAFPVGHDASRVLLIVGLGAVGHSVLRRLIERWRAAEPQGPPLRVHILDRAYERRKRAQLQIHHKQQYGRRLEDDLDLTGWSEDIAGPWFDRGEYGADLPVSRAFVCVHDDHLALTSALTLRRFHPDVPVAVRMSRHGRGLSKFLEDPSDLVRGFGVDLACTAELLALANGEP